MPKRPWHQYQHPRNSWPQPEPPAPSAPQGQPGQHTYSDPFQFPSIYF